MKKTLVILMMTAAICSFTLLTTFSEEKPIPIPPSKQRTHGDVKKGYDYLVAGDYVDRRLETNDQSSHSKLFGRQKSLTW